MVEITVLVDNTVASSRPKGLRAEWGFAAVVDDVLFDTGQSDCARHNAELLGVGPDFEAIVLSHAHYDHTSGLAGFLDPAGGPTIYCHPSVWEPRYSLDGEGNRNGNGDEYEDGNGSGNGERNGNAARDGNEEGNGARDGDVDDDDPPTTPEPIGMELSKAEVERGAEVVEHRGPVEVADGVHALGEIPREHDETTVGKIERGGELVDDRVVDDQALAIEIDDGAALVLGCCHAGLRNSIEYAEAVTGEPVRHVVGGTHLVAMDAAAVHGIADWLAGRLETFAGCHCTGFEAQAILADRLPEAFEPVGVGSVVEIDE